MFKYLFFSLLFFFISPYINDGNIYQNIKIKADFIDIDNLGNIYSVYKNTITKYSENLEPEYIFTENYYGNISEIDVSDNFKIAIFFRDFAFIKILDNTLNQLNEFDLSILEFSDIQHVCNSMQKGFWIFENTEKRLFFIDEKLNLSSKSKFLGKYLNENEIICISEKNNKVYLAIKNNGILIFDNFANVENFINIDISSDFQFIDKNITFFDKKNLQTKILNLLDENQTFIQYSDSSIIDIKYFNKKTIILTQDSLKIL